MHTHSVRRLPRHAQRPAPLAAPPAASAAVAAAPAPEDLGLSPPKRHDIPVSPINLSLARSPTHFACTLYHFLVQLHSMLMHIAAADKHRDDNSDRLNRPTTERDGEIMSYSAAAAAAIECLSKSRQITSSPPPPPLALDGIAFGFDLVRWTQPPARFLPQDSSATDARSTGMRELRRNVHFDILFAKMLQISSRPAWWPLFRNSAYRQALARSHAFLFVGWGHKLKMYTCTYLFHTHYYPPNQSMVLRLLFAPFANATSRRRRRRIADDGG